VVSVNDIEAGARVVVAGQFSLKSGRRSQGRQLIDHLKTSQPNDTAAVFLCSKFSEPLQIFLTLRVVKTGS